MPAVVAMCQIESSNYRTWINLPFFFIWACFYTSVESDTCIPAMRVCSLRRKFRTILKTSEKLISTLRLQTSTQVGMLLSQHNVQSCISSIWYRIWNQQDSSLLSQIEGFRKLHYGCDHILCPTHISNKEILF